MENKDVSLAGRIMAKREMARPFSPTLPDDKGRIQLYVRPQ
jgi:lysyl-tRNA synthetase class II